MTKDARYLAALQAEQLKRVAERSLPAFVRQAWPILEPTTPFLPNWHIDLVCEYLEAVTAGEIRRLVINLPPRYGKSLLVSVLWPVWEWIRHPATRWVFTSYAVSLAGQHSQDRRTLLQSSWYCGPGHDFVVGLVAAGRGADIYLVDRVKAQLSFPDTLAAIRQTCRQYSSARTILVEDTANGPAVIDTLRHEIPGIIAVQPQGDKVQRATACAPRVEAGNVYLPRPTGPTGCRIPARAWVDDFIEQVAVFPKGAHDDDVDAFTQLLLRWHPQRMSPEMMRRLLRAGSGPATARRPTRRHAPPAIGGNTPRARPTPRRATGRAAAGPHARAMRWPTWGSIAPCPTQTCPTNILTATPTPPGAASTTWSAPG